MNVNNVKSDDSTLLFKGIEKKYWGEMSRYTSLKTWKIAEVLTIFDNSSGTASQAF